MVISVCGKMQFELSKERQVRKKKVRTWTEAAKLALELYPKTPMGHKDIFNVIRAKGLKDVSGPASLACLNAMLHVHSRGPEAMFYRVDGCTSVFGLASNIPEGGVKMEVDEEDSGQEFDPGDSDQDSEASLSPCGRKKDRVLYVRLPPGHKNVLSLSSNALCNLQADDPVLHKTDQLTVKPLAYKNEYYTRIRRMNGEKLLEDAKKEKCNQAPVPNLPASPAKVSQSHSQRAIKHALRQQQKRRRRNTAIAASGNAPPPIPRIIMKSLPPAPAGAGCVPEERWRCSLEKTSLRESTRHKPQTMRELLASIPGLSFKPRKRSNRKLSTAAQIAQTKKGCINIETPDSILVNTNLRALLNKHTFASLPAVYQYRLVQLLPQADRMIGSDYSVRLTGTALSNEFFARACQEWKKRLQEGEFTPENQMKLKGEAERDHNKLDPWKIHNFEPVWGHTSLTEFSEKGKSSPFLINSQLKSSLKTPAKHVPSIKIKPVRRSRFSTRLAKHLRSLEQDSPSHSDENHPCVDSPLYNEASDVEVSTVEESSENLFGPPSKKLKVMEPSSNSSESQESSEESLPNILQHSPCPSPSSVMSTPSPAHSIDDTEVSKEALGTDSSDIPISLSVTVVQTTAPSQSIVPPITIRSIPVKKSSGRNDGGMNLERSYQICKAALESNNKKDAAPPVETAPEPLASIDPTSMVTSSVTSSDISPLDMPIVEKSTEKALESIDSQSLDCSNNTQEVPSSTNQLLLTTCLPATPTFLPNSVSSTINSLETSNLCTNAEVSSLDSESVKDIPEEDRMDISENLPNLNLPVLCAADSTSIEDPEAISDLVHVPDLEVVQTSQSVPDLADDSTSLSAPDLADILNSQSEPDLEDVPTSQSVPDLDNPISQSLPDLADLPTSQSLPDLEELPTSQSLSNLVDDPISQYLPDVEDIRTSRSVEDLETNLISHSVPDLVDVPTSQSSVETAALVGSPQSADVPYNSPSQLSADMTVLLPCQSTADVAVSPFPPVSPTASIEDSKNSLMTEDMVEDMESSSSMNIVIPEYLSPVKEDDTSGESFENSATPSEQVVSQDSISLNSNSETNIVSSSLQNDTSFLPPECLDSDSSSLQQPFNNSQVVDEDSTIILSLPQSEDENLISDDPTVNEENIPAREILVEDDYATNKFLNTDNSNSCTDSLPSPSDEKQDVGFDVESQEIEKADDLSCSEMQFSFSNEDRIQSSSKGDKTLPPPLADEKLLDSPSTDDASQPSPLTDDKTQPSFSTDNKMQLSATIDEQTLASLSDDNMIQPSASIDDKTQHSHFNFSENETPSLSIDEKTLLSATDQSPLSSSDDKVLLSSIDEKTLLSSEDSSQPSTKITQLSSTIDDKRLCEVSTYNVEPIPNKCIMQKQFDPPDRPLSAPLNFTPVSMSVEANSLKRPASSQSYYRSSKVTPIVYFDSPESDEGERVPISSPFSSDGPVSRSSSICNEESSSSSTKTDHFAPNRTSNSESQNKNSNEVTPVPVSGAICPRSSPVARAASTPSIVSSTQSPIPRPLSNPIPDSTLPHPTIKLEFQNFPTVINHLPEGCTGGTGGILPSQAVSVVPAATQLPIASGGVMFPSVNGLASAAGTPAGDTPPRSLLQSSPIINGASSGIIEGAVTNSGGDSGRGGSGTSGRKVNKNVPRKKYFLRKRNKRKK